MTVGLSIGSSGIGIQGSIETEPHRAPMSIVHGLDGLPFAPLDGFVRRVPIGAIGFRLGW